MQIAENDNTPELDQDGNPIPNTAPKNPEDNLLQRSIDLVTGKTTIAQLNGASDSSTSLSKPRTGIIGEPH